jgi:AraC-like DNA-binding protein
MISQPVPNFRAAHLLPYLDFLYEKGLPVEQLLRKFNLPTAIENQPDARLPLVPVLQLLSHLERREGLQDLGILVSSKIDLKLLNGANRRAILEAPDLTAGLSAFLGSVRDESSVVQGWTACEGSDVKICETHQISLDDDELRPMKIHFMLLSLAIVRAFAGTSWSPKAVGFPCRLPLSPMAGRRFPNTRFLFGQSCSWLSMPAEMLALQKKQGAAPAHQSMLTPVLPLASMPARDLVSSLKDLLKVYLAEGYPSIELAADISGMSVRTLQRNLARSQITYSKVVEIARFEAAVQLLGDPGSKIIDVAYAVGYQDPSHFSRAFRRFAGTSPREYRMSGAAA